MSDFDNELSGALFKAKEQKTEQHPGYTGNCQIDGKEYWISAWVNKSKAGQSYFSLKFNLKEQQQEAAPAAKPTAVEELDDDIPF